MKKKIISILCTVSMLSAFLPIMSASADAAYYLLTKNEIKSGDISYYATAAPDIDLTKTSDNNVTYTASSTLGGEVADPSNLTGGNVAQTSPTLAALASTYDNAADCFTVDFDLGVTAAVDRVDVFTISGGSSAQKKTDNITVSYFDGESWQAIKNMKATGADEKTGTSAAVKMTTIEFTSVSAQKFRIEAFKVAGVKQQYLSEILIFGKISDLSQLNAAISKADEFLTDSAKKWYTSETTEALNSAVNAGKALNTSSSAEEIDSAVKAINNAISALVSVNERLVVSGNIIAFDTDYYKALTPSITLKKASNTPSYSWDDDALAENTFLTDGRASRNATNNAAPTNLASVSATFDLGTTAVIDRTDVFTVSNATASGQKKTKEASVFYSMNGTDWTKLETKAVEGANESLAAGTTIARHTIFTFAPVTAKYIKVNFVKADGAMQQFLSEVIIFGIGSDFSALTSKISEYSDISLLEKYATAESYNTLNTKLTEAKAMVDAQTASPDEIAAKAAEIDEAFNAISYKVSDYGILSNNLVTTTKENQEKENPIDVEGDKDLYAPLDNVNVGMTLLNEDLTPNTDITNALFGGHILEGDGKYGHFYAYDNTKPATNTVIADATEEVYFTGTDLYECYRKGTKTPTRTIDKVTVYVSSNGTDFEKVCEINNDCNEDTGATDGIINKIGANFMPVKGRYLKFVFTSSQYKAQVPFELVIKGFKDPNALHYPLSCEATYYIVGTDGETVIEDGIAGADAIWVGYNVINNSSEDKNYNIYAAIYNSENKLLAVKQATASKTEGTELEATFTELGSLAAGSYMVSYIWDGMTPMAAPLER